jgi:chromosome segregation ATPase
MTKKKQAASSKSLVKKSTPGLSLAPTVMETLGQMARKTGLSRSALLEQILKGAIAIASPAANMTITLEPVSGIDSKRNGRAGQLNIEVISAASSSQPSKSLDNAAPKPSETKALQKQLVESQQQWAARDEQIVDLQNQLKQEKTLRESQVESDRAVQKQLQEQDRLIAQLQNQLKQEKTLRESQVESDRAVQKQLQEQDRLIAQLQNQLGQEKTLRESQVESDRAVQKQLQEQDRLMAQLQNLQSLERQCQERDRQIENLQHQLEAALSAAESHRSLQQQSEQQTHLIADLQQQVAHLQSLANLGELQLNRWSSRTFSR